MRPRPLTAMCAAAAVVVAGCAAGPVSGARTPEPPPSSAAPPGPGRPGPPREVATGLKAPWGIAFVPGGDALVTERDTARLLRVGPEGRVSVLGTVPGVEPSGEGGLLGVAVSPTFGRDRYVYLYLTAASDNRVVRLRYGRTLGRPEPILTGIPKGGNHNGGRLAFGPDGLLYVATGETGRPELAQNRASLGGKILRIRPDGSAAPGNPFGTRVFTYGHRNVQGLAWDGQGRMYATEFGQNRFDEINRIEPGRDYGWPAVEGTGGGGPYTDPLLTWSTAEASPSGLAYAGGSLWAAGLRGERLWEVPLNPDGTAGRPVPHYERRYGRLRAAARAPDGSLWVMTSDRDGRGRVDPGDDRILVIPLG
jgi:glucose/arabinose dehydrogenase